jgi:hypothetical protein
MAKRKNKHSIIRRYIRLAVIPHAANQYRPHLVRRYGLMTVLVIVFAAQFISIPFLSAATPDSTVSITSAQFLNLTNHERQMAGAGALTLNAKLSQAAYSKAKDMFAHQYWAHTSPTGTPPWQWIHDAGYNYGYAGENLAKNFLSSQAIINAWMASPNHKENILKPQYRDAGFAAVSGTLNGRPTLLIVALYASPASSPVSGARLTAVSQDTGDLAAQIGAHMRTISPAAVGSAALLLLVGIVALAAHFYRHRLPHALQTPWYRHHGAYKAFGLFTLAILVVALYNTSSQI